MPDQMSKKERIQATIGGEEFDRPPVSTWRHFYQEETSVDRLTEALLSFQDRFDWDFVKVNPRANFMVEDWGVKSTYGNDPYKAPDTIDWPVKKAADWDGIRPLNTRKGALGEHLGLLNRIGKGLKSQTPFIMTVFTPLSIAGRLAGSDEAMKAFMEEDPARVHHVLQTVAQAFVEFSEECLNAGASGLFYATTHWATYDMMTDQEYEEFGRPYDLKVLQALSDADFNVLHVCQGRNMLRALADYPVHAFNWDTQDPTNVWLKEGREATGKAVVGGMGHRTTLVNGAPDEVAAEVQRAKDEMGSTGWMLGTGCTFPPEAPEKNLSALRRAVAS